MVWYQVVPVLFLCGFLVKLDWVVTRRRIVLQKLSYSCLAWLSLIRITNHSYVFIHYKAVTTGNIVGILKLRTSCIQLNQGFKQTLFLTILPFVNNFLTFFRLRLNSCARALYVNCLTHHSLSLCLLNWPTTRHLTTCYCQLGFQTTHLYAHSWTWWWKRIIPRHLIPQFLTIYLHLYSNPPTSYFLSW